MKKIKILSFASLPLAMALLAGCGHQHSFSEEWNHDENKHWHDATCEHKDQVSEEGDHVYGDDNVCDVCGYDKGGEPGPGPGPGPGPTEGEVTDAEWFAAFGTSKPFYLADNYKLTASINMAGNVMDGDLIVDGSKLKSTGNSGEGTEISYNEIVEGQKYVYSYNAGAEKWFKSTTSETAADDLAEFFMPFASNYSSFTFDVDSKSYKCASLTFEGVPFVDLMIKFENKQITALALATAPGGGSFGVSTSLSIVYGGQVVDLPNAELHTHDFSNYGSDDDEHWKQCECGETLDGESHYDGDFDNKCDVCQHFVPAPTGFDFCLRNTMGLLQFVEDKDVEGQYKYEGYDDQGEYISQDMSFDVCNIDKDGKFVLLEGLSLGDTYEFVEIVSGVLTFKEDGNYKFYLKPNPGADVLYIVKAEGPIVGEAVYGYSYNNGEYQPMVDAGGKEEKQWQLIDFHMAENDTLKFADIVNPEFPIEITYLEDNGNIQGFTNVDGVLTAPADGYYSFTLNIDDSYNARIVVAMGQEPAPLIDVYLMGDFDEWTSGMIMQLNKGSTTEYVIKNVHISAGGKFKVRQGTEDSGYCGTWKTEGEKNALNSGLLVLDNGDAKALVDIIVDVYYESAIEGGQGFGTYVELNSVARAYKGVGSYRGVDEKITFDFDKVENGYAQYYVNIPEGYVSADFVYSITRYDNLVEDIVVEQVDEGVNFVRQADNTFIYSGSATTLDLYLKVYLDGSGIGLYVGNAAKPVDDRIPKTVTLKENQAWAFNDPNVVIFGWVWGPLNDGSWIEVDYEVGSTSTTVLLPAGTTGLLLVRCPVGTVTPNWDITSGDEPGRIYNKTKNVTIGTPDSYELDFVDYPEA